MIAEGLRPLALSADHFRRPLDFIRDQHARQATVCDLLDALAGALAAGPATEGVETLLAVLTDELALHTLDEERDLFPLLERRCLPGDDLRPVLDQLRYEHELDRDLVDFIVSDLRVLARGHALRNPLRLSMNLRAFTATQRRHLAWENAVVLPLAEKRLTGADLRELGRRMAARRGLPPPG